MRVLETFRQAAIMTAHQLGYVRYLLPTIKDRRSPIKLDGFHSTVRVRTPNTRRIYGTSPTQNL
jgi:hypothetical protein